MVAGIPTAVKKLANYFLFQITKQNLLKWVVSKLIWVDSIVFGKRCYFSRRPAKIHLCAVSVETALWAEKIKKHW